MILIMFYKYACHEEIVTGFSGYRWRKGSSDETVDVQKLTDHDVQLWTANYGMLLLYICVSFYNTYFKS